MNRRARPAMMLVGILLPALMGGCDRSPKPPAGYSNVIAPKHRPSDKPTTQEILSAVRQPQQLGIWPLTIDLPQKLWSISYPKYSSLGSSLAIEGPTPSGDVHIQVSSFPNLLPISILDQTAAEVRKKQAEHPEDFLLVDLRTLDQAKVLEEREIRHIATHPATQSAAPATNESEVITWSLRIMTPHSSVLGNQMAYDTYVLGVIGMSRQQYEQDHAFVEQILQSLKYHPADLPGVRR